MRPFRALFRGLSGMRGVSAEFRQRESGGFVSLLTLPFRFAFGFAAFMVQSWAINRSGSAFVKGFPAVLAAVFFLAGLWAANFFKEKRSVGASQGYFHHYLKLNSDRPEYSRIFAEKLVELKPEDDMMKYQLGLARELCGENEEALDVMRYLAPDNDSGYCQCARLDCQLLPQVSAIGNLGR